MELYVWKPNYRRVNFNGILLHRLLQNLKSVEAFDFVVKLKFLEMAFFLNVIFAKSYF